MFKSGDKVVCVSPGEASLGLVKDKVYTCLRSFVNFAEEDVVEVLESMPPNEYEGYRAVRFRKALPSDLKKEIKEKIAEVC